MTVNKLNLPAKANAVQSKINEIIDNLGTSITVDQTYDGTSANPQSGAAINGELTSNYQTKLVSGTNIKTINNTSLLGSGNIDTSELFIAEYGSTTYNQILTAYNAGKEIICRDSGVFFILSGINLNNNVFAFSNNTSTQHILKTIKNNVWTTSVTNVAKSDLSNVSSISSSSAVYTALGNKQDTLVSGTNIKTINNTSLLGSGNISLVEDDTTISKNSDDELQTIGVIDDNVQNAYNFTVVGSPTITDDGIASGFSDSNYITGSFTSITPSKIIFRTKVVYSSTPNAANGSHTIGKIQGTNSSPSIEYNPNANWLAAVRFHNNSYTDNRSAQINNIPLNDGDIVEAEVIATSTSVTLNAKINGVPYTNTWSGNGLYCGAINGYIISNNSNWYWTGSIDLKQFSITVDGVEVYRAWQPPALKYWTGTKAQYDAIATKNANTLYNVEGVGLYKGTTFISNDGVSKSGDTMTGALFVNTDDTTNQAINIGNVSTNQRDIVFRASNHRVATIRAVKGSDDSCTISIGANSVNDSAAIGFLVTRDSSDNASCSFPATNCVDGQYTETNETIVSSLNLNNSSSSDTGWYTLSSLPDDGEYLCWIIGRGTTGSTSGNYIYCRVVSDIVTDYMTCCATRTRTASTVTSEGVICIPVKNKRVKFKRDATWNGTGSFGLRGYRRIGTNA